MGTPKIAIPTFKKLIELTDCITVYTGQDKIQGRGRKYTPTPIKQIALENSIHIEQPSTFKDVNVIDKLKTYNPDFIVVMAYGFILPVKVLNIPNIAPINLHGSILPSYRGASPIHQALLNNDKKTGVTAQFIVKKMDAGDILHIKEIDIEEEDNYESLSEKIANASALCIEELIEKYKNGEVKQKPQDEMKISYCKKIKIEDGLINWNKSADRINGEIKAYYTWPHSYSYYEGKKIIFKKAMVLNCEETHKPGQVIQADKNGLHIQTGDNVISILELQLEKKKVLDYKNFLNGFKLESGNFFQVMEKD